MGNGSCEELTRYKKAKGAGVRGRALCSECSGDVDFRSIGKGVPMERFGKADPGGASPCFGVLGTGHGKVSLGGGHAVAWKRRQRAKRGAAKGSLAF